MLAVFNRFDKKVEEAALTLGASRITTFRRITLPLVLPGVIGAGLFGFSLSYDEYPRSMFTTGPTPPCRSPSWRSSTGSSRPRSTPSAPPPRCFP